MTVSEHAAAAGAGALGQIPAVLHVIVEMRGFAGRTAVMRLERIDNGDAEQPCDEGCDRALSLEEGRGEASATAVGENIRRQATFLLAILMWKRYTKITPYKQI